MSGAVAGTVRMRTELLWAGSITVVLAALFAWLCAPAVREFFPYAEEWKILWPSMPGVTHVVDWFRGFADTMTDPYPAWAVASVNFVRPIMNAVYWARLELFGDNWGAQLYVNFVFVGLNAGVLWLGLRCYRGIHAGVWLAAALTAAYVLMPPMVSADVRFMTLLVPQMPFDPLLASFYILACLAYIHTRYVLAAIFVVAALMTKEQALPLAAALPLTYAWTHRRQWRESLPTFVILALPVALWLFARLFLFGSVAQGVYVMLRDPLVIARGFVSNLLKLPLYAPGLREALVQPLSLHALLVACNGVVLVYLVVDTWRRWRSSGPEVLTVTVILCWGFLALVGLNPRYGAPVICLTLLMLARHSAPGVPAFARGAALSAVLISAGVHGLHSVQSFPAHLQFSRGVYEIGHRYAAALAQVDTSRVDTIVVLNEPNTMYTAPSDLARVMKLPVVAVHKASDYPWPWPEPLARSVPQLACTVEARTLAPGRVEFDQSCGLQIMGARVPAEFPLRLPLDTGISVDFPDVTLPPGAALPNLGRRLIVELERSKVGLLYFDPEQRSFEWIVPGQIEETPENAAND